MTGVFSRFSESSRGLGVEESAPIILAGSTHSGEESMLGEIVIRLRRNSRTLLRGCAQACRTLEGSPRATREARAKSSDACTRWNSNTSHPDTLLVNTTGELRDWYDQATVVFIGKSLTAHGGQNPAEAVAAGKPVDLRSEHGKFRFAGSAIVREGGALQVSDATRLEEELQRLLSNAEKRLQLAANGARCLQSHCGATARTCQALEEFESSRAFRKGHRSAMAERH